jgi:glycosyltransferase involved in cell wall biosynthesis
VVTPGRQGILVRKDDPFSLASALHLLAADPALRGRLAAEGRASAQAYAWERVVDQVVDVYGHALERFRPRQDPREELTAGLQQLPEMVRGS